MNFLKKNYLFLLQIIFIVSFPVLISSGVFKYFFLTITLHKFIYLILCVLRCLLILDLIKKILSNYYTYFIKEKQVEKKTNKRLLLISVTIIFLLCEIIFNFVPQSQKVQKFGLANYNWNVYYKQAYNEKGFRDEALKGRTAPGNKKVFFVGDSYTYGDGIKNNKDRFTDIIKDQLSLKHIETFNLGKGNIDTRDEYHNLISFGIKPDVMVLQYYLNDIEKAGEKYGHFTLNTRGYGVKKESTFKKIVLGFCMLPGKVSYFINYMSLSAAKFLPVSNHNKYKECITESYSDTLCLNEHKKDIQNIIDYCRFYKIKLYVLFVPDLRDIDYSQGMYSAHIAPLLDENNVRYISIDAALKKHKTQEIIVNPLNPHANELANKIIAQTLLDSIEEFK